MTASLVSILIPCYNAERWIAQSIQSALDQTYPNKEIIVADDGSTDGSARIIESFGRVISFHRLAHQGGNAARNTLTQLAGGEWLQYLDADDYLRPGKIALQIEDANRRENVDVVYSPVVIHHVERPQEDHVLEINDDSESITFIRWGPLNTGGLLLKRRAVIDAGGWKQDQPCCQEHELLLRLMMANKEFLFHNRAETVYRQHGSHTVSRRNPMETIRTRVALTEMLVGHLRTNGRLTEAHREAWFVALLECARSAFGKDPELAEQLSARARALGRYWISSSPALPLPYQVVFRLAGFHSAERVAGWMRSHRTGATV